jgi:hypothetical protein
MNRGCLIDDASLVPFGIPLPVFSKRFCNICAQRLINSLVDGLDLVRTSCNLLAFKIVGPLPTHSSLGFQDLSGVRAVILISKVPLVRHDCQHNMHLESITYVKRAIILPVHVVVKRNDFTAHCAAIPTANGGVPTLTTGAASPPNPLEMQGICTMEQATVRLSQRIRFRFKDKP